MHAGQVETTPELVHHLLGGQFPEWADLSITPVESAGTVNALYRIGDRLVARLPLMDWGVDSIHSEHEWLPRLAPHLPISIPKPVGLGRPAERYPFVWSIYEWLDGEVALPNRVVDSEGFARDLAGFIDALQKVDPTGAPRSGRGTDLGSRDTATRTAIAALKGEIDSRKASRLWEESLRTQAWHGAPVWVHGDLLPNNILMIGQHIAGIIDFGDAGLSDPARDLVAAWSVMSRPGRDIFRSELPFDEATWQRGRGWAFTIGVVIVPYYTVTNPALAAVGRQIVDEVLDDFD